MEALVTALGIGIVFLALIGLSVILGGFNLLWGKKPQKKEEAHDITAASSPVSSLAPGLDPLTVAVITAAVTAMRGHSAAAFRIAKIEKAGGFSTPVWGHIERSNMQTGAHVR